MAWDISPLRQFVLPPVVDDQAMRHHSGHGSRPSLSDESPRGAPNCLAANGLGAACLAIGTDQGAVWLVDRYSVSPIHFPDNQQLQVCDFVLAFN
ncbi:unnamed protein product [Protopolystoma xenopodis]|uniref:Uncharacterized protein n=1 Tax=Protopolystoma xenopodis TaxID=117903 RepID=A0A448X711_9PLAT|nr:unnamed protein product [Protopolystoma xenopodis]